MTGRYFCSLIGAYVPPIRALRCNALSSLNEFLLTRETTVFFEKPDMSSLKLSAVALLFLVQVNLSCEQC